MSTMTTCLPCELATAADAVAVEDVPDIAPDEQAYWSGPIGMEGEKTGDGRLINLNALRWDNLPIPLRWAPQDFGAHEGAVVVGKITAINRNEEGHLIGDGVFDLGSKDGREAFRQVKEGLTPGISMDLDDLVVEDKDDNFTILEGRVRAATIVAIPAFEGARIAVSETETFDAGNQEFNWVDEVGGLPQYIKRISKHMTKSGMPESRAIASAVNAVKKMCATGDTNFPGVQNVNAGSRAEACAAVAEWEEKKARAKANSGESLVAGATVFPHEWFSDQHLSEPTGFTVDDKTGQVFGHIALWGTCHIANPQGHGVCTQPPRSQSDYAYFRTGVVSTTAGDMPVGKITMNTLHAGPRLSSNDTVYHYEHTGSVGAYVVAGEDEFGIWVAGAAHPNADLTSLKAAPISGDWRTLAGNLEMVGALSVNVPGFPVPRPMALVAGGAVQSLIASGVVDAEERSEDVMALDLNDPASLRLLRERFRDMDRQEKADALAAKVARFAALEKVRRVALSVGTGYNSRMNKSFAFNPDQWRVPKGNGRLSGRFIDMPDSLLISFDDVLKDVLAGTPGVSTEKIDRVSDSLSDAMESAGRATNAIRAGDGDTAKAAADAADVQMAQVWEGIQDIDSENGFSAEDMKTLGDSHDAALDGLAVVRNSDLSLLGDEGIGSDDAPEADIGADDVDPETVAPADADELLPAGWVDDPKSPTPAFYSEDGEIGVVQNEDGKWVPVVNAGEPGGAVDHQPLDGVGDEGFDTPQEAIDELMMGEDSGDLTAPPADDDDGRDSIWDGFEEQYIKNSDPDSDDESPDFLRTEYDNLIDEEGLTPLEALDRINESINRNRNAAPNEAPPRGDMEDYLVEKGYGRDVVEDLSDRELYDDFVAEGGGDTPSPEDAPAVDTPADDGIGARTTKAEDSASRLENVLIYAADNGMDETYAPQVGDALADFREKLDTLNSSLLDGSKKFDPVDLDAAQTALSELESQMMIAADQPGMSDDIVNQLGTALDDMFADLGAIAQVVQGSMEPPPFATRKYVRQWLGRKGIRLGTFTQRG